MSSSHVPPLSLTVVDIIHLELWGKAVRLRAQQYWGIDTQAGDDEFASELAGRLRADLAKPGSATFSKDDVKQLEFHGKSMVTHGIADMVAPGADFDRQENGAKRVAVGNALLVIAVALRGRLKMGPP